MDGWIGKSGERLYGGSDHVDLLDELSCAVQAWKGGNSRSSDFQSVSGIRDSTHWHHPARTVTLLLFAGQREQMDRCQ